MLKFLIGLLIAAVVVIAVAGLSMIWLMNAISVEKPTPLVTANEGGASGTALIVHHPGLSDFPDRIMTAYADGLIQAGWQVDRTTASKEAPADFSGYDVVILGGPVYGGLPKPLSDYIGRVDFSGKPVVIVLTGAGETLTTRLEAVEVISKSGGKVIERLAYTTMTPNRSDKPYQGSNTDKAVEMARDAGKALALLPQ